MPKDPKTVPGLVESILAAVRGYEFRTLVVGFERPADYDRTAHEARFRDLKIAVGEEVTRRLEGVDIDFRHPELRVEIHGSCELRLIPAPIFIAGRYRKLSREIPASRWIHHNCRGRGCPSCLHTGNLCGPSVEELLSKPVLELSGGERTFFHALGREDTDARMLGRGRPFVLEVHRPVRRTLPLETLRERFAESAQFAAEIGYLALVDRSAVAAVKGTAAEKTYRAWVRVEGEVPADAAARVGAMAGLAVEQMSPRRVMHRRGKEKVRTKRILESTWVGGVAGRVVWEVRLEAGTYLKELVSGDGGRTRPSLSDVLGSRCVCEALDVLEVHWGGPWEASSGA